MRVKLSVCRLCMGTKNINEKVADNQTYKKISECLQVEINLDDAYLPIAVCSACTKCVRKFYRFRKECWKVQRTLLSKQRDFMEIANVTKLNLFDDYGLELERNLVRPLRPVVKKEMMIEIQQVQQSSPSALRPVKPKVENQTMLEIQKADKLVPVDHAQSNRIQMHTQALQPELQNKMFNIQKTQNKFPIEHARSNSRLTNTRSFRSDVNSEMRVQKQEIEMLSPMDYTRPSCNQNRIRALQRTAKKEIMVEIQEVEINSPTSTLRSKTTEDEHLLKCLDYKLDLVTNELEGSNKLNYPMHTPKENDSDEKTLEQETDNADQGNEAAITNREYQKSRNAMDNEAIELEQLRPENLEEGNLEPVSVKSEPLELEVLEEKSTGIEALDLENYGQPEHLELESLEPEILDEKDISMEPLETKYHLKPHDYTSKQPCSVAGSPPKTRPKPRRRTTNISGKALYKSLLMACDTCGKMIERNRLEGHRNKHMGIRPYSCPNEACNAAFHCKHARRLHVRCRHGNESFSCDICGRVYRARRDLLGHKREAHSEPKFECDICFKKFTTRSRLKQHRFYHTGERNHPCGFCIMTFFNNFQLKVHMRTHTQARPFVCKVCRKAFRYRHMAKDHIIRQHGIDEKFEKDWITHNPEPEVSELMNLVKPNV